MLKADFHIHTFYSPCSNMRPEEIVKVSVSKGYDVLGVVDHNNIKGGNLIKKISGKKILIIPGEEIMTNLGEVIVFLSDGKYNRNLDDICERCRQMNHYLIVPHPFDFLRFSASIRHHLMHVKHADAVEIFNSRCLFNRFNSMAKEFSIQNKIPQIVGSDAHFYEEIGNVTAFLNCEKNIDSIFNFIRKNNMRFEHMNAGIKPHIKSLFRKIER